MSIPYVDEMIYKNTDSLLKGLLSNSYIIKEEVLNNLPDDLVNSFIHTYCNDSTNKGRDIPLTFTFPSVENRDAFILIQYKGSSESPEDSALGNVQGQVTSTSQGTLVKEHVEVVVSESNVATVTVSNNIYGIQSIPQCSSGSYSFSDDTITIPYIPPYSEGDNYIDVFYYTKVEGDGSSYIPYGVNTNEGVTIDVCSTNLDTLRCLTGLLEVVYMYLKVNLENNEDIYLPNLVIEGSDLVQSVNDSLNSANQTQLFYRRLDITYKVTNIIQPKAGPTLDEFISTLNIEGED